MRVELTPEPGLLRATLVSLRERLDLPRGVASHEVECLLVWAGEREILNLPGRRYRAKVPPCGSDLDAIAPGVKHAPLVNRETVGAAGES